jgi:hypothetical protein
LSDLAGANLQRNKPVTAPRFEYLFFSGWKSTLGRRAVIEQKQIGLSQLSDCRFG